MKKVINAIRLYLKTSVNPVTLIVGIFIMFLMSTLFVIEPHPAGSEDYMSMISSLGIGHVGVIIIVAFSVLKPYLFKFYVSSSCAKHLFITAPIVFTSIICLTYDVIFDILAYINIGASSLADIMIFNSIYSGVFILFATFIGKQKYEGFAVFPYLALLALSGFISKNKSFQNGFGIPVSLSVIITLALYMAFIMVTVIIANRWWKTGNRTKPVTKTIQALMGWK